MQWQQENYSEQRVTKERRRDLILPPKLFDVEQFWQSQDATKVPLMPGDGFVATFPKCGTTWMQHLVYHILHKNAPLTESMYHHLPWMGAHGSEDNDRVLELHAQGVSPVVMKSHLPWEWIRRDQGLKYIYVVRNPKDVVVSLFHHARSIPSFEYDGVFDNFFERFMAGEVEFGCFFQHVLGWWKAHQEHPDRILWLSYEEMKEDCASVVKRVAAFLGAEHEQWVLCDDNAAKVVHSCSFDSMKSNASAMQSFKSRKKGGTHHLRKGVVGDWKNHLSEQQAKRVDERVKEELLPAGLVLR